jgi:hypothetical protein
MRRVAAICCALSLASGCGSDDNRPLPPLAGGGSSNASGGTSSGGTAGAIDGASGSGGGGSAPTGEPEVLELTSPPCTATDAAAATILEADPLGVAFDRAGVVGDRRYAFDSATLALMTFASDGSATSQLVMADFAAVAAGDRIDALELDSSGALVASTFDGAGERLRMSAAVAPARTGSHALAVGDDASFAVWREGDDLFGRIIARDGTTSDAVRFGSRSCGDYACRPAVVWNGHAFVIVWSRVASDGTSQLSWAAVDRTGAVLSARRLLERDEYHQLVDMATLDDGGVALLVNEGFPATAPLVLFLDAFGSMRSPTYRLLGAREGFAIASHSSTIAVVARSSDEQAVFRSLTSAGEPLNDGWVCLGGTQGTGPDSPRAAIFGDATGYGVVRREADGSSSFLQINDAGFAAD